MLNFPFIYNFLEVELRGCNHDLRTMIEHFPLTVPYFIYSIEAAELPQDLTKQAFQDNINMDLKKGKIGILAKGILHDFGQKVEVFSSFVFIKNRSRKSVF